MPAARRRGRLGVVGGLGPLASSEFLRTIYEYAAGGTEQAMPAVMLWSDPAVPDRTRALANGDSHTLLDYLASAVGALVELQCSPIVVCCVTMHALVPELPPERRERILSLVDVVIEQIRRRDERQLLFCSSGTRAMQIFERHPRWPDVERLVVLPEPDDQKAVHDLIHAIKGNGDAGRHLDVAGSLLRKYGVRSLVVGCSEFHLLAKAARSQGVSWSTCDPLDWIARAWNSHGLSAEAIPIALSV